MRKIQHRLYRSLKHHMPDLIQEQRHNERGRKSENKAVNAQNDRVSQNNVKVVILEHRFEMGQSHPGAPGNPLKDVIVLKNDNIAQKRDVFKNEKMQNAGQAYDKKSQLAV